MTETQSQIYNKNKNSTQGSSSNNHHTNEFKCRLLNWIKILVFGLVSEAIAREKLYKIGIYLIEILQSGIEENILLITLMQLLSLLATKYLVIISVILFYNYLDMYTTLLLAVIGGCGSIGTGFFKLIYKNPRPFFHEHWVKVYDCETGYGNPSGHSIVAVSIYLTLWKVLRKRNGFFERNKRILFGFVFCFICAILLSRLALGAHSLNQILLGSFIGYQIYSLFFHVIKIEVDLHKEIEILMKLSNFYIFVFSVSIFLITGILIFNFYPITFDLDVNKYLERIMLSCPGTPYSKTFDYEAYFMLAACSSLVGAYYGIYYDIKFNLNNSQEKWIKMNHGKYLWNRTNYLKGFVRIFILIILLSIPFSLTLIVSSRAHTNYIFLVKNLIPYFFVNFFLFAYGRHLCCRLKYGNPLLDCEHKIN
jgi:membrane-associated phospholipid phosphatase